MRMLILGGTGFLGRHLVEAALAQGHEVTLFNRGNKKDLFPESEQLIGDRDGNLSALCGKRWDAVIDTCSYVPRLVRDSARLLAGAVERYTFISSVSVYGKVDQPGISETAPVAKIQNESAEEINGDTYGALKALCENAAQEAMPDCVLVIRPGLIAGPWDLTDRFTYWVRRVSRGGSVLAAGPDRPVQFIDVRDLAEWIVLMNERLEIGTFNATGPDYMLTMEEFLYACNDTTGGGARFMWADDETLERNGVRPWVDLPLWIPERHEMSGFCSINCEKAMEAGLIYRPLVNTIRDTMRWDSIRDTTQPMKAGLSTEREREILSCGSKPAKAKPNAIE